MALLLLLLLLQHDANDSLPKNQKEDYSRKDKVRVCLPWGGLWGMVPKQITSTAFSFAALFCVVCSYVLPLHCDSFFSHHPWLASWILSPTILRLFWIRSIARRHIDLYLLAISFGVPRRQGHSTRSCGSSAALFCMRDRLVESEQ